MPPRFDPVRRALLLSLTTAPLLPQTVHAGGPRPLMLAGVYRPGMPLQGWWVSEKYDGVRAYWDGQALWTRHGHRIRAPAWFTGGWPAQPMDGELWAGHGRFTHAASAAARDLPDHAAWRTLRYMAFDLPAEAGPFDTRIARLHRTLPGAHATLQAVAQHEATTEAALQALLHDTVHRGGEGLMLHRGASAYRGERSDDLLKLKPHLDAEATVVGHVPGRGKYDGLLGALLVETPQGLRFKLGSGLRDADRVSPPAIGSQVTYRYRGLHPDGVPRFASFVRVRVD
jgi:DNA ligase 1